MDDHNPAVILQGYDKMCAMKTLFSSSDWQLVAQLATIWSICPLRPVAILFESLMVAAHLYTLGENATTRH